MLVNVGDVAVMKKQHPCGGNRFEITRTGADIKIRCIKCGRVVMLDRPLFERRVKSIEPHRSGEQI